MADKSRGEPTASRPNKLINNSASWTTNAVFCWTKYVSSNNTGLRAGYFLKHLDVVRLKTEGGEEIPEKDFGQQPDPSGDEYLRKVTVGELKPHNSTITLRE